MVLRAARRRSRRTCRRTRSRPGCWPTAGWWDGGGHASARRRWTPLVVDPVMIATSGDRLLSREAEQRDPRPAAATRHAGDAQPGRGRASDRARGARRGGRWSARAGDAAARGRRRAGEGRSPRRRRCSRRRAGDAGRRRRRFSRPRIRRPGPPTAPAARCQRGDHGRARARRGTGAGGRRTRSTTWRGRSRPRRGWARGTGR